MLNLANQEHQEVVAKTHRTFNAGSISICKPQQYSINKNVCSNGQYQLSGYIHSTMVTSNLKENKQIDDIHETEAFDVCQKKN